MFTSCLQLAGVNTAVFPQMNGTLFVKITCKGSEKQNLMYNIEFRISVIKQIFIVCFRKLTDISPFLVSRFVSRLLAVTAFKIPKPYIYNMSFLFRFVKLKCPGINSMHTAHACNHKTNRSPIYLDLVRKVHVSWCSRVERFSKVCIIPFNFVYMELPLTDASYES